MGANGSPSGKSDGDMIEGGKEKDYLTILCHNPTQLFFMIRNILYTILLKRNN